MPKALAALALAAAAFAPPAAAGPQDEFAEMKWEFKPTDKFDLKWSFSELRKSEPGVGPVVETIDRREVEAELSVKEEPGWEGRLLVTLKKAAWTTGTHDYEITLTYLEGKPADVRTKLKADPRKPEGEAAKAQMATMSESIKKLIEGEHSIDTTRKGDTIMLRNGQAARMGASIFDRIFFHPKLPVGTVKAGQTWRDPVPPLAIQAGLIEVKTIDYKVTTLSAKDITVKGGFTFPIVKPPTVTSQKVTGNFTFTQEYSFSRENYQQSSKEESLLTKKVDATGKDSEFYKENTSHTLRQALKILKRPPPKQPDEKKPGEKK
jgi:hypothetical protein